MWYCFIQEDLDAASDNDPLAIQSTYAQVIKSFCVVSTATGNIVDDNNVNIDLSGQSVFLRGSCEYLQKAMNILEAKGCCLLENTQDVDHIEHWESLGIAKRQIVALSSLDVKTGKFSNDAMTILLHNPVVFLKSRKKGFSATVASYRLLNVDREIIEVIDKYCEDWDELLLSEWINIKRDSLGAKESRHIIRNNKILNSSRQIHSLIHAVPKTLLREADRLVELITQIADFPDNYVLDLGIVENNREQEVFMVN